MVGGGARARERAVTVEGHAIGRFGLAVTPTEQYLWLDEPKQRLGSIFRRI